MFSPQLNFLRLRMRLASWLERPFRFLEPHEYLPVGKCLSGQVVCSDGKSRDVGAGSLPAPNYTFIFACLGRY